ncbi:MAG: MSHA biogenesis protein MshJ [Glaciecola sp.]|jgi:MSHA biogenesis protein MshJ
MSSSMNNLEKKFSAISAREQKLVFYTVPFLICFVFILGFIEPAITKTMESRNDIRNMKLQLSTVANSLDSIQLALSLDPDVETKNQIEGYSARIGQLEKQFADELQQLVPPRAIPLVLEQLFAKAKKLKLVKMRSIAPRNIFDADAKNTEVQDNTPLADGPALYQHGLRITFEGSFFDTRDFLVSAEQLVWKLHWHEVLFKVNEYPKAQVDIELFTLSMSEVYINVN